VTEPFSVCPAITLVLSNVSGEEITSPPVAAQ